MQPPCHLPHPAPRTIKTQNWHHKTQNWTHIFCLPRRKTHAIKRLADWRLPIYTAALLAQIEGRRPTPTAPQNANGLTP
jgi:hypothetical protein